MKVPIVRAGSEVLMSGRVSGSVRAGGVRYNKIVEELRSRH